MGVPVLLLTTRGRRSRLLRTTPLLYVHDGDALVVAASNGGSPTEPPWSLNLSSDPVATAQVRGDKLKVRARHASDGERERLWRKLCAVYPSFDDYQGFTERRIPVVVLDCHPEAGTP